MGTVNKLLCSSKTTEIDTVSGRIIAEYEKSDWSADTHLTGIFDKLKPASEELTKAINRIKAESELEEKDELRDIKIRAIYYLILGLLHHPDETVSTAAQKVDDVFEHYGVDITEESYATESSLVESLLEDLEDTDLQTAIEAVPVLSQAIDGLKTAQAAFEEAKVIYEEEKAEERTEENATTIKKEAASIINEQLVTYLRAMIQVDETTYGEFTRIVAGIIEDNNTAVKKRRKGSSTAEEVSES
ncbi:MAG: DUF6261 family protein [Ignavibacteria bacterium]|jgi:hypothetical protein